MKVRVGALAVVLLAIGGAHALAQSASVSLSGNQFSPKTLEVDAGTTVTWRNDDPRNHTVTADDQSFDSHPNCGGDCMQQGQTFSRTFNTAATVAYHCKIHGGQGGTGMSGTIVVRAAATQAPATAIPTAVPPPTATPRVTATPAAPPSATPTAAPTATPAEPSPELPELTTTETPQAIEAEPATAGDEDDSGGLAAYLAGVGVLVAVFAGMLLLANRR